MRPIVVQVSDRGEAPRLLPEEPKQSVDKQHLSLKCGVVPRCGNSHLFMWAKVASPLFLLSTDCQTEPVGPVGIDYGLVG
jgi:hypothetical protein